MVALMFSNLSSMNLTSKSHSPCRWLRGYKHQNRMCRHRKGLPEALIQARNLAVSHCEEQFRFDRWNCSYKKSIFKKAFRETAFLHAISSSAIMYSIAKACADGKLQNCRCAEQEDVINAGQQWRWGGCGDNLKQARKITKKVLQLTQKGDGTNNILNYNSVLGIKTVDESDATVCKCHGVSASCVMKTCWKSLIPFNKIAEKLKQSYHNAVVHLPKNTIGQTIKQINNNSPYKLLYFTPSSNYCSTTSGRHCKDVENCATLCCGRGFHSSDIVVQKHCKCRWQRCCYDVVCDTCSDNQTIYICK